MADIADILSVAENPVYVRVSVARILLRQDLVARHVELEAELARASTDDVMENRTPTAPRLAEELRTLEAEMDAAKVEFRFRSIGKRAWADLLAAHPPTKEQARSDKRLDHNPSTFPVAAIAASCTDPVLTVDDATRLEAALNATQFDMLWAQCIDANVGGAGLPKSVAAGVIHRVNGQSVNTAAPTASPDQSSLAGS